MGEIKRGEMSYKKKEEDPSKESWLMGI